MNLLELGALLKRERERRRLSLRDVMEATKISRRNLNALEDGDVRILPHPVYLKGYVRNYARLLGLDAEPLVLVVENQSDGDTGYIPQVAAPAAPVQEVAAAAEDGLAAAPAEGPAPAPAPEPEPAPQVTAPVRDADPFGDQLRYPHVDDYAPRRSSSFWPWIVLGVVALAMALLYVQYRRISAEVEAQAPAATAAPAELPAANATPSESVAPEAAPAHNASAPQPEPPAGKAPSEPGARPAASALNATVSVQASPVEVSRKAGAPEPRTPGMQELVVTAKPGESCWVEVSDGQMRKSFTLKEGESRRVEFSGKARVRLGNAGGVGFTLNGVHYPYEGVRGQVETVEIGAQ